MSQHRQSGFSAVVLWALELCCTDHAKGHCLWQRQNTPHTNKHTATAPLESVCCVVCGSSQTDDSEGSGRPTAFTKL